MLPLPVTVITRIITCLGSGLPTQNFTYHDCILGWETRILISNMSSDQNPCFFFILSGLFVHFQADNSTFFSALREDWTVGMQSTYTEQLLDAWKASGEIVLSLFSLFCILLCSCQRALGRMKSGSDHALSASKPLLVGLYRGLYSLKLTFSHLKIDGWEM